MKITYYYKDACRIYWRLEFTESKNGNNPEWEVTVLRSLEDHDDLNAHEVFHTSIPRSVIDSKDVHIDVKLLVSHMQEYYNDILRGFNEHILTLYEPKIEE